MVPVTLFGDISAGTRSVKAKKIGNLPDAVREEVKTMQGRYSLRAGIAEIDGMVKQADLHTSSLVHLPTSISDQVMVHINNLPTSKAAHIDDVYWGVKSSVLRGLLDQVRTTAVSILTEIRVEFGETGLSRTEAASNAIHLHVDGGKRNNFTVTTNQSSPGAAGISNPSENGEGVRWTRRQTYWTIIGVAVALVALYFAIIQGRS